jgi:hypothetical protein
LEAQVDELLALLNLLLAIDPNDGIHDLLDFDLTLLFLNYYIWSIFIVNFQGKV